MPKQEFGLNSDFLRYLCFSTVFINVQYLTNDYFLANSIEYLHDQQCSID